jgi:Insertion element 4 transposase N-terminal
MLVMPSSIPSAPAGDGDAVPGADLAGRVLSGPGLWLDWLEELQRESLLEELLAGDVIARALEVPRGHRYDRTLTAKMTVTCVLVACMFPGRGYDTALATAFGLPGLNLKPSTGVPSGPAFSKARRLLGEQVMRRLFELDAARGDADLGIARRWKDLEVTALDGTTMELARNDVLADVFGVPGDGARPLMRIAAHVRTATRRWIAAATGGYLDGENPLADGLAWSFTPGIINLADRGFFSMDRWIRFSAAGAHLAWRARNGAKSIPFKVIRTLPDGSELVMLHESDGMRTRRRREAGDPHAPTAASTAVGGPQTPCRPARRHPRPARAPRRPPADIRPDPCRTPHKAHRRSRLHHQDHRVKPPAMGRKPGKLRAVWPRLTRDVALARGRAAGSDPRRFRGSRDQGRAGCEGARGGAVALTLAGPAWTASGKSPTDTGRFPLGVETATLSNAARLVPGINSGTAHAGYYLLHALAAVRDPGRPGEPGSLDRARERVRRAEVVMAAASLRHEQVAEAEHHAGIRFRDPHGARVIRPATEHGPLDIADLASRYSRQPGGFLAVYRGAEITMGLLDETGGTLAPGPVAHHQDHVYYDCPVHGGG